jgi:hypothetical protein
MSRKQNSEAPICWWLFMEEYEAATTLLHCAAAPPEMTDPAVFLRPVPLLLAAGWEAFHRRCAHEATAFLAGFTPKPDLLPKPLLKRVAKELREERHDLGPWRLSGEAWRAYLVERGEIERLYMGSGKTHHVDDFYEKAIGLQRISSRWKSPAGLAALKPTAAVDGFIKHRDSIAHRGESALDVKACWNFYAFAVEQAIRTIQAVTEHLLPVTGSCFSDASMAHLRRSLSRSVA